MNMIMHHLAQRPREISFVLENCFRGVILVTSNLETSKGQLILKCPFGSSNLPKKQRNVFKDFCPILKKRGQIKISVRESK